MADTRWADARGDDRHLRRHPGLSRRIAHVVDRRAASRDASGHLAHRDPWTDALRGRAGAIKGSVLALRARLDRRTVEPRPMVVVFPERRRVAMPGRSEER